jgi:hypothetical protein
VEYLLGNHTVAETMFRLDPRALLYAPLRVLVYADADGNAVFPLDQPSAAFGSLGIAEVTKLGETRTARWQTCCGSSVLMLIRLSDQITKRSESGEAAGAPPDSPSTEGTTS